MTVPLQTIRPRKRRVAAPFAQAVDGYVNAVHAPLLPTLLWLGRVTHKHGLAPGTSLSAPRYF